MVQIDTEMTYAVIGYTATLALLIAIIFQVHNSISEPHSEPSPATEKPSLNGGDIVHCAALGCPGNPPNPHGPPTEEP